MVLQCKDKNRTPAVQFLLTELLPRLAVFNPKHFRKHFIEDTLQYLTTLVSDLRGCYSHLHTFILYPTGIEPYRQSFKARTK